MLALLLCRRRDAGDGLAVGIGDTRRVADDENVGMTRNAHVRLHLYTTGIIGFGI